MDVRPGVVMWHSVADSLGPMLRKQFGRFSRGFFLVLMLMGQSLRAGPEVRSSQWAIDGFRPPPRWEVTSLERPSYPQLIAWASRGDGTERATIGLVGQRVAPKTTVEDMVAQARTFAQEPNVENVRLQILSTTGWMAGWTGNKRLQLDAQLKATKTQRAKVVRQHFLVSGSFAYVLTLVAPIEQSAARLRDLDDTAARLTPLDPVPLPQPKDRAPPPEPAAPVDAGRT